MTAKERLKAMERYFERGAKEDFSFWPEFNVASKINQVLERGELDNEKIEEVILIFNEIIGKDHYNGSGWLDYKWGLERFFREAGIIVEFQLDGKLSLRN